MERLGKAKAEMLVELEACRQAVVKAGENGRQALDRAVHSARSSAAEMARVSGSRRVHRRLLPTLPWPSLSHTTLAPVYCRLSKWPTPTPVLAALRAPSCL